MLISSMRVDMDPVMMKSPEKLCKVSGAESVSVTVPALPISGEAVPNHFASIFEPSSFPPARFRMAVERLRTSGEPRRNAKPNPGVLYMDLSILKSILYRGSERKEVK